MSYQPIKLTKELFAKADKPDGMYQIGDEAEPGWGCSIAVVTADDIMELRCGSILSFDVCGYALFLRMDAPPFIAMRNMNGPKEEPNENQT